MTKRGYSLTLVGAIAVIGLLAGGGLRAAEPSGESNSTIKPSPVNFHGKFGSITFPEKFPPGTTL